MRRVASLRSRRARSSRRDSAHACSRASCSCAASRSGVRRPSRERLGDRAAGLAVVAAVGEAALAGERLDVGEHARQPARLLPDARELEPRRVDHDAAARQRHELARGGGVAAAVVGLADRAGRPLAAREGVEQRGLADAGGAQQHAGDARPEQRRDGVDARAVDRRDRQRPARRRPSRRVPRPRARRGRRSRSAFERTTSAWAGASAASVSMRSMRPRLSSRFSDATTTTRSTLAARTCASRPLRAARTSALVRSRTRRGRPRSRGRR